MQDYIKVPFELDITKNIEFDRVENAVTTVRNAIKNAEWQPDTLYLALFVNLVPKLEKDEERKNIYYKIKEILLYEDVLSQVIKSEHLYKRQTQLLLQYFFTAYRNYHVGKAGRCTLAA